MIFEIFRIFEWTLNLKIIVMYLLKAFFSTSVSIFLNLTLTNSFVRFFVVINFEYILFYLSQVQGIVQSKATYFILSTFQKAEKVESFKISSQGASSLSLSIFYLSILLSPYFFSSLSIFLCSCVHFLFSLSPSLYLFIFLQELRSLFLILSLSELT